MSTKSLWRSLALLAAFALVAASCGDSEDTETGAEGTTETTGTEGTTEPTETEGAAEGPDVAATGAGDGVLAVGTLQPITGSLAFLGPPQVAGARLAVQDINAAGGVLGTDVRLIEGDEGDTSTDIANPTTDRLLREGADAIIGAASSAVSKLVIDKITGAGVIQFSPSNTSDDFTDYPDDGFYFRTAPPDVLQGQLLANVVAEDGHTTLGIIYRQESYGEGLANRVQEVFEELGGDVVASIAYAPDTDNFDAGVDQLVAADPEAIAVIGFEESASTLTTMHERGIGPQSKAVYGVDGNIAAIGGELADPSILTGMKGTQASVDLSTITEFTDRLEQSYQGGLSGVYIYGAETYDAIVITALAAEVAGTDDPASVADEISGVTKDGTGCTTFAQCKDLVAAGEDIDYDGLGGPYEFIDAGEPAAGSFRIATYDGGALPNPALDEYRLVELQ